jgi:hypothetical protein
MRYCTSDRGEQAHENTTVPKEEQTKRISTSIWTNEPNHSSGDSRINIERRTMKEMTSCEILMQVLTKAINWIYNWKHPGSDGIQNYWHKKPTSTGAHLLLYISYWLNDTDRLPKFLTQGTIYLQTKRKTSKDPSHYRSITCSQTLYAK